MPPSYEKYPAALPYIGSFVYDSVVISRCGYVLALFGFGTGFID